MTVRTPFTLNGPTIVSFSGGRTSGMMLWKLLAEHGGKLPDNCHVLFANTGKERLETLDFVQQCADRWSVPIVWLEYLDDADPQRRFHVVDFHSASRQGEPFEALIRRKSYLPNPVTRFCTSELKIRVMKLYAQQVLGFDAWDVAIGFRADEPERVAKLSRPHREPFDRFAPLAASGVSAADVGEFWKSQPFDLALPNHNGVAVHGNCDLCFLKGSGRTVSLIAENPQLADWWIQQERSVGSTFRNDRPSYQVLQRFARDQIDLFGYHDADLLDCGCTD